MENNGLLHFAAVLIVIDIVAMTVGIPATLIALRFAKNMTKEAKTNWMAQILAVVGVCVWMAASIYCCVWSLVVIISMIAIPATIYNLCQGAQRPQPVSI